MKAPESHHGLVERRAGFPSALPARRGEIVWRALGAARALPEPAARVPGGGREEGGAGAGLSVGGRARVGGPTLSDPLRRSESFSKVNGSRCGHTGPAEKDCGWQVRPIL